MSLQDDLRSAAECIYLVVDEREAAAIAVRFTDAAKKIDDLTAELAAAKRDAGRYRWLRNDCPQTMCTELFGIEGAEDELDEAIDDAIEAEREGAAKYAAITAAIAEQEPK